MPNFRTFFQSFIILLVASLAVGCSRNDSTVVEPASMSQEEIDAVEDAYQFE